MLSLSPVVPPLLTTAQRNAATTAGKLPLGSLIRNSTTLTYQRRLENGNWVDCAMFNNSVQALTAIPIDWSLGLFVEFTMPAANVTTTVANYLNPIAGERHVLILKNATAASRNFVLPTAATHKSPTLTVAVGTNQRRKLSADYNGSVYDWTVEAAKTL